MQQTQKKMEKIVPGDYADGLIEKEGIFYAATQSNISYPGDGNDFCYQLESNSFWFKHRNNCIVECVKKYTPRNIFFDIGGGNGFVAKALEENGISTVLVEPGISGCLNAKKYGLPNIIHATLEDAAFKNNSIPAIGLFDVVEHIEKDGEFLRSVFSILKNDGYVFITVPAYKFLWSEEDVEAGHFRRYTTKTLEAKLKEAGFGIIFSTYIFSVLPIPIFFARTLPNKFGLGKNKIKDESHRKDHEFKKGMLNNFLNKIWRSEVNKIRKGISIPFGGSCLIVAKKF